MAAASDVIMLLWLPWKPINQQGVSINWKYKIADYMCQISSQLDEWCQKKRGGGPIDPPPTPYAFV